MLGSILAKADHVDVGRDFLIAVGDAHPGVMVRVRGRGLNEELPADDAGRGCRPDVEVVAPGVAVRSNSNAALIGPAEQVLGRVGGNPYECRVGGRGSIRGGVHSADEIGVVASQREQDVIGAGREVECVGAA